MAAVTGLAPVAFDAPTFSGRRLRARRIDQGLTMMELAALTGLTDRAISHLENGIRAPLANTAARLAYALNCDMEALFA